MKNNTSKYTNIYEPLYQRGYHAKSGFSHSVNLVNKVIKYLPEGSKILDVGSSNGTCVNLLTSAKFDAYGIDISETAIKLAEKNGAKNCVFGSATDIPFSDSFFDAVISSDVLEHIFPEDIEQTAKEIYRVVKTYAFIKVSTTYEKNTSWVRYLQSLNHQIDNLHVTRIEKDDWLNLFTSVGFSVVECEPITKHSFEIILLKE